MEPIDGIDSLLLAEYPAIYETQRLMKLARDPIYEHPNYYHLCHIVTAVVSGPKSDLWIFDHDNRIVDYKTFCDWMHKLTPEQRKSIGAQMLHLYTLNPIYGRFYAMTVYPQRPHITIGSWDEFDCWAMAMTRGRFPTNWDKLLYTIDSQIFIVASQQTKMNRLRHLILGSTPPLM